MAENIEFQRQKYRILEKMKFLFVRETVRDWKTNYQCSFLNNEEEEIFVLQHPGQYLIVSDELITKTNTIFHNPSASGRAIPSNIIAATGNGVLSSQHLELMAKNSGNIMLTIK